MSEMQSGKIQPLSSVIYRSLRFSASISKNSYSSSLPKWLPNYLSGVPQSLQANLVTQRLLCAPPKWMFIFSRQSFGNQEKRSQFFLSASEKTASVDFLLKTDGLLKISHEMDLQNLLALWIKNNKETARRYQKFSQNRSQPRLSTSRQVFSRICYD